MKEVWYNQYNTTNGIDIEFALFAKGAAHGLVGILFALMLFPEYLRSHRNAEEAVRATVDYLISVTPSGSGNLPAATDELPPHQRSPNEELVHWCHGAAGQF